MGRKYRGKWGQIGRKPPQSLPRFCPIATHRSSPPPVWGRALREETVDGVKELRLRSTVVEEGMDHLWGTRWPPWGKMAAMGQDGHHGGGGQGQDGSQMGQDGHHGDKMAILGVGDRDKMAAMGQDGCHGARWLPWGWGTGTRWPPWGQDGSQWIMMAAMGFGGVDKEKMAATGTR